MSTCFVDGITRRSSLSEPDVLFGSFGRTDLIDMHHLMGVLGFF
jgi:hypothetical protein